MLPPNIAAVLGGAWQLLNSTPWVLCHPFDAMSKPSSTYLNGTPRDMGDGLGRAPIGIIIYHPNGYMSANMAATEKDYLPPVRSKMTDDDFILVGKHTLSYAGELHAWEGSNETVGTFTHGPLIMANRPSFLATNQTRNYIVTEDAYQGRDVLHLWLRNETSDTITNVFWARNED